MPDPITSRIEIKDHKTGRLQIKPRPLKRKRRARPKRILTPAQKLANAARQKEWRLTHQTASREYSRSYYWKNRDRLLQKAKANRAAHRGDKSPYSSYSPLYQKKKRQAKKNDIEHIID